ncbi:MAG TPA: ABC transporter substrate-binding protein [Anaeromyxobacteraceae bacterium]|nr:ABC transporter substrate-binding protein [Anaeromyxobacteraceae bacterium]
MGNVRLWAASLLVLAASAAGAEEPLKIGLIAAFSGPFADYGREIEAGMKAYMKLHGDKVAGRKVEIIVRDTTGPLPDVAKRHAQELVVREKVDFLAGFGLTPEALAVAEIATQAKKPMIVMNAATSIITAKSPYVARVSFTLAQDAAPMGTWAARNGIKKVFTLVADYGPGIDAEAAFKKSFAAAGGQVVDSIRTPLRGPEFAPFLQRIKDERPQAVFVFLPAGEQGIAFMKGFRERGLAEAGIQVIATGDVTDDHVIDAMGEVAQGMITSHHYSAAHDSPENKAFLEAYQQVAGSLGRANFMAVGGFDGMAAIYDVARKLGGKIDGDKAMAVLKGWKHMSPRGPISIDPETRDVVQTVYIRKVEKRDGHWYNVEFEKFPEVKDPGK